jgi:hypothetical protein
MTVEISRATCGRRTNSEENFNVQPKKNTKYRAATVKMDQHTPQGGKQSKHCLIH